MTAAAHITAPQLKRLQVLYGQFERRSLDVSGTRQDRLVWASTFIRRPIGSFKDLTLDEARQMIDGLQRALGVALPQKPRQRGRRDAEKAGTEGRRDQKHAETTMVADADIRRVQREMQRLGWDQAGLQRFLASSRNPIGGRTVIRTLGDANRVYWALKRMVPRAAKPGEPTAPGEPVASEEVPF